MAKAETKSPNEMSFLDHLEVLRWHLIRSVLAIVIIGSVAFFMKDFIFDTVLFGPKKMDFPTYKLFCKIGTFLGIDSDFCADELPFTIQSRSGICCTRHLVLHRRILVSSDPVHGLGQLYIQSPGIETAFMLWA